MDGLEEFEKALAADKAEREREGRDEGRPEKRERHRHGHDQGPDPDKGRDGKEHHHHHHHRRRHRSHGRDGADDSNPGDDDQAHRPKRSRRHSPDHDRTRHHRRRDEGGGDRATKRTDHPHHRHHRRRDEDGGHDGGGREDGGRESGDDRPPRRTHSQHHRPRGEHEVGGGSDTDPPAKLTDGHHRPRDQGRGDENGDDDPSRRHQRQRRPGAPNTDAPAHQENDGAPPPLVRDAWMTTPSALDIDYVQRQARQDKKPARTREEPDATAAESRYTLRMEPEPPPPPPRQKPRGGDDDDYSEDEDKATRTFNYTIGDEGSQWRMTKLRGVYTTAKESGRSVEEVALGRFGTIREFDDAREEQDELERRRIYGQGYARKERPTGELYRERKSQEADRKKKDGPVLITQKQQQANLPAAPAVPMDQTALNRLRARLMKAKLRNDPAAAALEAEYDGAVAAMASGHGRDTVVVLGAMHHRELAGVGGPNGPNGAAARGEVKPVETRRGRERGLVGENSDMTVDDMVREERRTRGQPGGEGRRLAERIARDGRFTDNLEYMDENAEKLARRVHRSDASLRHVAADEYQRLSRALESCPLCYGDDETPPRPPAAPVVALGTRTYLTLPPEPELSPLGAVIVPLQHRANLLGCDDDEWEEIRNFMKGLTRLHHDMGREVVFYENAATSAAAASRRHHRHAALVAVSIPYEHGATAPAFFREAMLAADEEWAQHRKVIDTQAAARDKGLGRMAFRRSIAREMPYFHVWFTLDGGLGHVVEDEARWPRGDLFAREVLGGIMDVDPAVIKKQGRWRRGEPAGSRLDEFKARWRPFDWTRVLREQDEQTAQQRSKIETG